MDQPNYLNGKNVYLHLYGEIAGWILPALRKTYDKAWLKSVKDDGRQEFLAILPHISYIGEKNVWKFNLIMSGVYLAIVRAARKHKATTVEAVQLLYDLHEAFAAKLPVWLSKALGRYWNTPNQRRKLRDGAARSQLRQYPGDWVFTYVDGDGLKSDYNIDISECAILKFYRTQGEEALVPFLCKLDFFLGKTLAFGFEREGTLAEGKTCCDCRYLIKGETTGWNPRVREFSLTKEISDQVGLP